MGFSDFLDPVKRLTSVGNYLGGGGADPGKKQLKGILGEYQKLNLGQQATKASALFQQGQGLNAINKGYGGALGALGAAGSGAKRTVLEREQENLGSLKAGLVSSGLDSSTLNTNLQRGVYSDTSRNLADIDEAIGQLKSNLLAARGHAQAGQYGAMAGIHQGQGAQQTALGQSLIGTLGNVQYSDPNAWLQNLFQIGGAAAGAAVASDRRLKHNVEHIGGLEYEFSYRGSETRYRGVMADEVPHAVTWRDGVAFVDYSKVPVAFRKVS